MGKSTEKENEQELENKDPKKDDVNPNGSPAAGADDDLLEDDDDLEEGENKKEKTFTQFQLNRMLAKEKKNSKATILKELGLDGIDKDKLGGIVSYLKSAKTPEEKNNEKIKELEEKLAQQTAKNLKLELNNLVLSSGVSEEFRELVSTFVLSKLDEDTEPKDIIDELKEKHPTWFDLSNESKKKNAGTGKNPGVGKQKGSSGEATLAERLAKKKEEQFKNVKETKSFWDNNH